MINKVNSSDLKELFKDYKLDYIISNNEYVQYYAYKIDNKYIAFLCFMNISEEVEIIDAFVLEKYRRNNIMTSLFNYLFKNEKYTKIFLEVSEENIGAINLYNKLGFKVISVRKGYYNGIDAYVMEKK
jgi:ribosomal-protein-alanine N-acetyltransferase